MLSLPVLAALSGWFLMNAGRAASPGALDTSFAVGGSGPGSAGVVLLQPDGRVIIGGTFLYYQYNLCQGIARLNSDASIDSSFNAHGIAASGNGISAGYLYEDGRVLIAGGFYNTGRNRIARLASNGDLDNSFDPGAGPNGDIQCVAVQGEKIIVGGAFTTFAGQAASRLARLNSDGSLDTNFVAATDNDVHALALQPDGKVLVGGWFSHLNGVSPAYFARLNADGSVDSSFAPNVGMPVERVVLQPDGRVLVAGNFKFTTGVPLGRVMPNGSWDPGFSVAVGPWVSGLQLQNDGRILIGGSFSTVNGVGRPYLARLYSDGSTDLSFSSAVDNMVGPIVIQPDNRIIISGGFGSLEGVAESGLARLYGDDPTATPAVQFNGASFKAYQNDAAITIPVFRSGDTNIAVSAHYTTADIDATAGADYVGNAGTLNFAPGEVAKPITVTLLNDGQVESAERFSVLLTNVTGGNLGSNATGTVTVLGANNVIQIVTPDIVTNEMAGAVKITLTRAGTNLTSTVVCLGVNGTAVAGINFSNLAQTVTFTPGQATNTATVSLIDDVQPGPDTSFTVQLNSAANATIGARSNLSITILENDAPGHPAFGVNGVVEGLASTSDGGALVGGSFISINGIPRSRIGKIWPDGSVDQVFAPPGSLDGTVFAVLSDTGGKIVCGGTFTNANGSARPRLTRLNSDGTLDNSFDPGAGADSAVVQVVPSTDGGYFACGFFGSYGGVARRAIVKITANGSVNTNFVPQTPSGVDYAYCIAAQPGGGVLVGTSGFTTANTNVCFRLRADGSRDTSFTNKIVSAFPGSVYSLAVQPDGKIVLGGFFADKGITRVNTNGGVDLSFNPAGGVYIGTINKVLVMPNGKIIAGGDFWSYAGIPRRNLVRINESGSIDSSFDPGRGSDDIIYDIAPLPGNRLVIGGAFLKFVGFSRRHLAILDATGKLVTRINCESIANSDTLDFGLAVEPDVSFQLLQSFDLWTWQVVYSNLVHQSFTNIMLPRPATDKAFFKILQRP